MPAGTYRNIARRQQPKHIHVYASAPPLRAFCASSHMESNQHFPFRFSCIWIDENVWKSI